MYIRQIQKEIVVNTKGVENLDEFLKRLNEKGESFEMVDGEAPKERHDLNISFEEEQQEESTK